MKDWFEAVLYDVVDSSTNLSDVLRKARILASQLKSHDLAEWIDYELNGYGNSQVPDYRLLPVVLRGHFSGMFGKRLSNASIPLTALPEDLRPQFERLHFNKSIAEIENILEHKEDTYRISVPPEFAGVIGSGGYIDMNCYAVWQVVGGSSLAGVVDAVRTRLLQFLLSLSEQQGGLVPVPDRLSAIPQSTVSNVFNTTIGDARGSNLALGSSQIYSSSASYTTAAEVSDELRKMVDLLQGLPQTEQEQLRKAINTLADAADGNIASKASLLDAAERVTAVPALKARLIQIRDAIIPSLATSALWDAIKLAFQ